jgi:hypothetical protein
MRNCSMSKREPGRIEKAHGEPVVGFGSFTGHCRSRRLMDVYFPAITFINAVTPAPIWNL